MNDNTWIQELKAGDVVYIKRREAHGLPERATVARITTTKVLVSLGGAIERRFSRNNGRSVGTECWNRQYLIQSTPEVEAKHRIHKLNAEARASFDQLRVTCTFTEQEAQDVINFCAAMKDRIDARLNEVKA